MLPAVRAACTRGRGIYKAGEDGVTASPRGAQAVCVRTAVSCPVTWRAGGRQPALRRSALPSPGTRDAQATRHSSRGRHTPRPSRFTRVTGQHTTRSPDSPGPRLGDKIPKSRDAKHPSRPAGTRTPHAARRTLPRTHRLHSPAPVPAPPPTLPPSPVSAHPPSCPAQLSPSSPWPPRHKSSCFPPPFPRTPMLLRQALQHTWHSLAAHASCLPPAP